MVLDNLASMITILFILMTSWEQGENCIFYADCDHGDQYFIVHIDFFGNLSVSLYKIKKGHNKLQIFCYISNESNILLYR